MRGGAAGSWTPTVFLPRRKPLGSPERPVPVHVRDAMAETTLHIHVCLRGVWRLRLSLLILRTAALLCRWLAGFRTVVEPIPEPADLLGDSDA